MTDIAELERMLWAAEDDVDDDGIPAIEEHLDQAEIMVWLISHNLLSFGPDYLVNGYLFRTIARRGNLSWCCDVQCNSVISSMPFIMLLGKNGDEGAVELHWRCFEKMQKAGVIKGEYGG